jgi:hypothetical protein
MEDIPVPFTFLSRKSANPVISLVKNIASLYFTVENMPGCIGKPINTELYGSRQKAKDIY